MHKQKHDRSVRSQGPDSHVSVTSPVKSHALSIAHECAAESKEPYDQRVDSTSTNAPSSNRVNAANKESANTAAKDSDGTAAGAPKIASSEIYDGTRAEPMKTTSSSKNKTARSSDKKRSKKSRSQSIPTKTPLVYANWPLAPNRIALISMEIVPEPAASSQLPRKDPEQSTFARPTEKNGPVVKTPISEEGDGHNVGPQETPKKRSTDEDGIRKGPGTAVPLRTPSDSTTNHVSKPQTESIDTAKSSTTDTDADCLQRFLKIKVKQVTEKDGTVSGTLLVTPNALMFDPDVTHPLVKENGQDLYMMMAHMEEIMSVAVFKDIGALTGEKDKKDKMYDPAHVRDSRTGKDEASKDINARYEGMISPRKTTDDSASDASSGSDELERVKASRIPEFGGSDSQLPLIAEEEQKESGTSLEVPRPARRTVSDVGLAGSSEREAKLAEKSSASSGETGEDTVKGRSQSDSHPSTSVTSKTNSDISSANSRSSLSKLGRTLSARANSIRGSAGKVTQSAVTGTRNVAHGMVTHTKSAAGTLQTGIQTSAKMAATHAKVAVDAMVSVPQGIMIMGTGLFTEGQHALGDVINAAKDTRTVATVRREQSLATLEALKHKTQQAREQAYREREGAVFTCATLPDDKPDLFRPVQELLANVKRLSDISDSPLVTELPYYMVVRLNRKKTRSKTVRSTSTSAGGSSSSSTAFEEDSIGNRIRREFWFAIPKDRAESIYHFLLQWNPDKYGQENNREAFPEQKDVPQHIQDGISWLPIDRAIAACEISSINFSERVVPLTFYPMVAGWLGRDETQPRGTQIWIVRHAEREDNVNRFWRQWYHKNTHLARDDSPLSARGRAQAAECALRFAKKKLDHVFCSPYERCMETAASILNGHRTLIKVEPGLAEVLCLCKKPAGFQDAAQLKLTYPCVDLDYRPVYDRSTLDYAYERFRSDTVCLPRIRKTLSYILDNFKGNILIVSHGASIGAMHEVLTGFWNSVGQATVSKFVETMPKKFDCVYAGDCSHLSDLTNLRAY